MLSGLDELLKKFPDFLIQELKIISGLELKLVQNEDEETYLLRLEMCTSKRKPNLSVVFEFGGVARLKLESLSGGIRVGGMEVTDISERMLEGIEWQVRDFEDGVLDFYSRSARIDFFKTV